MDEIRHGSHLGNGKNFSTGCGTSLNSIFLQIILTRLLEQIIQTHFLSLYKGKHLICPKKRSQQKYEGLGDLVFPLHSYIVSIKVKDILGTELYTMKNVYLSNN